MAMLAGPRKRKRYNLVPRGKALYEDEARFGTKMLEKMGWSKGKGLGAKENGAKDFVRVRYKNDAEGLGFEERDDQWTQHEEGFDGLLKTLNGKEDDDGGQEADGNNASDGELKTVGFGFAAEKKKKKLKLKDKISGHSLEEKSKLSRARVHYKKFTRGKDLSRYSEKDLANIFGKKSVDEIEEDNGVKMLGLVIGQPLEKEVEQQERSTGDPYISASISVNDYFKQKMAARKSQLSSGKNQTDEVGLVLEEIEAPKTKQKKSKKLKETVDLTSLNGIESEQHNEGPKKKMKKKKLKQTTEATTNWNEESLNEEVLNQEALDEEPLNEEPSNSEHKKKKKKAKKLKTKEKEQIFIETAAVQDQAEEPVTKQKKDKVKAKEEEQHFIETVEDEVVENQPKNPVPKQKKAKVKAQDEGQHLIDTAAEEVQAENPLPKQKKSKKSQPVKTASCAVEQIEPEKPILNPVGCEAEVPKKKKGKKKKSAELMEQEHAQTSIEAEATKQKEHNKNQQPESILQATQAAESTKKSKSKKKTKADPTIDENVAETSATAATPDPCPITTDEVGLGAPDADNVYTISSFCAEKFRHVDLDQFFGSNLADITGYGMTEDVKLEVKVIKGDEERITKLWNGTSSKYNEADPKLSYHNYIKQVKAAKKAKQKLPNLPVKTWKRKNAFQGLSQ